MNKLTEFVERLKVIARAAVTYLTFASVLLTLVAGEIADLLPGETGQEIVRWLLIVVAWLGAAVSIIRRVTPVAPDERGLLPPLP